VSARIVLCAAQVPFTRGGAEVLIDSLAAELARRGHEVEVVRLPFRWTTRAAILESALAWRLVDVDPSVGERADLVIATRFPSYLVRHPRKVVWLVHQFRQVYELEGTRYSDFGALPGDERTAAMIRAMDGRALGEAVGRFAISRNVAERLRRFNGLEAEPLYPPPRLGDAYRSGEPGDFVFAIGRLDAMKRFDLLLRALAETRSPVRAVLAGTGPEEESLRALAARIGVASRVDFVGWIDDARLLDFYARALAVFYAPFEEDYGYVTVEAFRSARPVVTTSDAGGVLEFVVDAENGFICAPGAPREVAACFDRLWDDRALARRLGRAGSERVAGIGWDAVVERLLSRL